MYNLKDDKSQKKIAIRKIVKYIEKRISLFKIRKVLYLTTKNCKEKSKEEKTKNKRQGNKKQKEVNTKVKKK